MIPSYLDEKFKVFIQVASEDMKKILDERYFDTNPLTCMKEYLPFLAVEVGVNIDGLSEKEARITIDEAVKSLNYRGTVGSVKKALNIFSNTKLQEWFTYDGEPYHFKIKVSGVKKEEDWIKGVNLLNFIKNVRSKLDNIGIDKEINSTIYRANVYKEGFNYKVYLKIKPLIQKTFDYFGSGFRKAYKSQIGVNIPVLNIANSANFFGGVSRITYKNTIGVRNG